jgi:hypothetical protein
MVNNKCEMFSVEFFTTHLRGLGERKMDEGRKNSWDIPCIIMFSI